MNIVYSATVVIRSGLNPDLVLMALNGSAVIAWIDLANTAQQWTLEATCPNWQCVNFTLTNVSTGQGLKATAQQNDSPVIVSGAGDSWNLSSSFTYPLTATTIQGRAIRPSYNSGWNLNVQEADDNLGTPTILWTWAGGRNNEIWDIVPLTDIPPFSVVPQTIWQSGGGGLRLRVLENAGITVGNLPGGGHPDDYYWDYYWEMTKWTTGFSLKNQLTSQFLSYGGDSEALVQNPQMCIQALWTYIPPSDPNIHFGRVQSVNSPSMCMNIYGSATAGNVVGSYRWCGGQPNEIWAGMDSTGQRVP